MRQACKAVTQYLANNQHLMYTALHLFDNTECLLSAKACPRSQECSGGQSSSHGVYSFYGIIDKKQISKEINM